ncbi:hypothetical protein BGZ93_001564 [Podila epicladia]|nr:hypothetical protein BGZ93_001564 [Podila epicladia]
MDPRPIPPRPEQNTQQDADASNRSSPPTSGRKTNGAGQASSGLTLSITPPRFAPLATLDTSKPDHAQQHSQNSQNNGIGFQNGQPHYTSLTFHNLNNEPEQLQQKPLKHKHKDCSQTHQHKDTNKLLQETKGLQEEE